MSTTREISNKETFTRFQNVTNTHDPELISHTIDEIVKPDVRIRTPLPVKATGAEALKEVFARLHHVFPDLQVTVEDLIADGDKVAGRNSVSGRTGVSTWVSHQRARPSRTTKSSSSASRTAESRRHGESSMYFHN